VDLPTRLDANSLHARMAFRRALRSLSSQANQLRPATAGGRRAWKREAIEAMGLTLSEFREEMKLVGHKPFRADQIWKWIYQKGEYNVKNMTNIASRDHDSLSERFRLHPDIIPHPFVSEDGTRKWRLELDDGKSVETVYIPGWVLDEEEGKARRGAVCVSSQVGCTLKCKFCHTGSMDKKILRNLSASEIISQIMCAKSHLGDWDHDDVYAANRSVTHLVFMGMGEPLYNYHNVRQAIGILTENDGLRFSKRRITLSTSGVVPGIANMARDGVDVLLAVSLHAPDNALRSSIMDINRMFPIEDLMAACVDFGSKPAKRITFEYVMLDGVNDSLAHAEQLAELLLRYKIHAFVNLIPFNPWPGSPYKTSSNNRVHAFLKVLEGYDDPLLRAAVRWPKGRDIGAACGQLATPS